MVLTEKQKALLNSCPILKEFKDIFEGMSGSSENTGSGNNDSGNTSGGNSDSGNTSSGTNDSGNTGGGSG